ncbi:hypothetical protein [Candidatus Pelagibacter sp. HIMB1542]|uniref:hypothetical protein n=1 Tax=Candidatus Pelagibacter sp. HIMB1542 TaxID=3413346 RepID=UPI003F8480AC
MNASSCNVRFSQINEIINTYNFQTKIQKKLQTEKSDQNIKSKNNNNSISEDKDNILIEFNKLYIKRQKLIDTIFENPQHIDKDNIIVQISKIENDLIFLNKDLYHKLDQNFTNNLTSQVQIRALSIAKKSIIEKPFGFGYNNYYIANNYYKYDFISANPYADNLNLRDGTNLTVKLIVEFGLISIVFFFICFLFLISRQINFELKIFLLPFLITQGLRGAGYWNGGFLMVFMIILLLLMENLKIKKNK